VSTDKTWYQWS